MPAPDRQYRLAVPLVAVLVLGVLLALARGADASTVGATPAARCSSFGVTWTKTYNKKAVKTGNPVRILSACCRSTTIHGVNSCYVTVTLAGTADRGCETVNIGKNGLPTGPGKHENCLVHSTRQAAPE